MKKTIYYALSGLLLGIGADVPFMFLFGACGLGGVQWCAVLSLVALWTLPLLGGVVGFFIARKSLRNLSPITTLDSDKKINTNTNRGLKRILFFSSLPIVIFLAWYIFNIIKLTSN
ncbi:MAG: hypothetical protein UY63_C0006G0012 [Parcubacteria group bacterium GW2011_GWA2_51_10]|nr:MAG: hypothetical protein UY63_C0006G0012 [Parcubacteria group bacterium GW2011_GWA2_51_10]